MALKAQVLKEYREATQTIYSLCVIRYGGSAGKKYLKFQSLFDIILQGILLYVAIEDNRLCDEEIEIFELLQNHGSIIKRINEQAKYENPLWIDFSFSDLKTITEAQCETLNRLIPSSLALSINDFVEAFSEADMAIGSMDYLSILKQHIMNIAKIVSVCDGDCSDSAQAKAELSSSQKAFHELFEVYWRPRTLERF